MVHIFESVYMNQLCLNHPSEEDLYKLQEISFNKARQSIEKLGKIGRYSPEIIAESMLSLSEARNGKAHNNKNT